MLTSVTVVVVYVNTAVEIPGDPITARVTTAINSHVMVAPAQVRETKMSLCVCAFVCRCIGVCV